MVLPEQREDWENGSDGLDISTSNTLLTSLVKTGSSVMKFHAAVNPGSPVPNPGTLSARMRAGAIGQAAAGTLAFASPVTQFEIECWIEFGTLGAMGSVNGDGVAGSVAQQAFFQLSGDGGVATFIFGADGTLGLGLNGKAWIVDPLSAGGHQFINANGTLRSDHLFDSAGDFFVAGQVYKVRIIGDLTTFSFFLDDVLIASGLPVAGSGTFYDTILFGNNRHAGDIIFGDVRYADVLGAPPPSGGGGGDPFL